MAGIQQTPRLPSIPIPKKGDADSLYETVLALKLAMEMSIGTRGHTPLTHSFVQEKVPEAFNEGDIWVQPSTGHASYWNGSTWRLIRADP